MTLTASGHALYEELFPQVVELNLRVLPAVFLAGNALLDKIDQKHMSVRTTRNDLVTMFHQRIRHRPGVTYNLLLVRLEFRLHGFLESDGFGSDHVHQGTTLSSGENQ